MCLAVNDTCPCSLYIASLTDASLTDASRLLFDLFIKRKKVTVAPHTYAHATAHSIPIRDPQIRNKKTPLRTSVAKVEPQAFGNGNDDGNGNGIRPAQNTARLSTCRSFTADLADKTPTLAKIKIKTKRPQGTGFTRFCFAPCLTPFYRPTHG